MPKNPSNRNLFTTVFITGAAVLIIEIAAVRILSPFYGSSLYVLSSVLTVILSALSAGYWYGGWRADKEKSSEVLYSIISISGVFVLGLLLLSQFLLPLLSHTLSPTVGPLFFSFGLFFIPAFLLGIISPYVIKIQSLTNSIDDIGKVVGATFFWGTCGSIFGSLMTGFFLIPILGVTKTVVLVSILLVSLGLLMPVFTGIKLKMLKTFIILLLSLILGLLVFSIDKTAQKNYIYFSDGIYSSIKIQDIILDGRPTRFLFRDSNASSAIYLDSKELVFPYTKFSLLYKSLTEDPQNILVLGGGAYTVPRTLSHMDKKISIDVVDIEPSLFKLAKEYFDLKDTSKITNYPMDGRVFLKQQRDIKYDMIFGDIFGTDLAAPFHLTTHEFYNLVSENMSDDGVFILNVVGKPEAHQPSLVGGVAKTLKSSFPNVKAYTFSEDTSLSQNVIFVSKNNSNSIEINEWDQAELGHTVTEVTLSENKLANEILFTDDHSPIEYLASKQNNY